MSIGQFWGRLMDIWRGAWWRRLPFWAQLGALILLIYLAAALSAPLWAPFDPLRIMVGPRLAPPGLRHWLGTDALGRDVFSRVVWGARPVLLYTFIISLIAVGGGSLLGILCAYRQGLFDAIAMRINDILIAIPPLIVALLLISVLGSSPWVIIASVSLIYFIRTARIVRAATLAIASDDYVTATKLRGDSTLSIVFIELLPNVIGTILVEYAVRSGFIIVFIGAIGFLGFGAPPPSPEWGVMINEGREVLYQSVWPVLGPAAAMALAVVALNLFTDGVSRMLGSGSNRGMR